MDWRLIPKCMKRLFWCRDSRSRLVLKRAGEGACSTFFWGVGCGGGIGFCRTRGILGAHPGLKAGTKLKKLNDFLIRLTCCKQNICQRTTNSRLVAQVCNLCLHRRDACATGLSGVCGVLGGIGTSSGGRGFLWFSAEPKRSLGGKLAFPSRSLGTRGEWREARRFSALGRLTNRLINTC